MLFGKLFYADMRRCIKNLDLVERLDSLKKFHLDSLKILHLFQVSETSLMGLSSTFNSFLPVTNDLNPIFSTNILMMQKVKCYGQSALRYFYAASSSMRKK